MAAPKLVPEKITSPIQLMAAWFAMLVLLETVLLTAANRIEKPEWAAGYLVIFSSIVVIAVIACVTAMLTIFRPHLQEGKEYAQWLKDKNKFASVEVKTAKVGDLSVRSESKYSADLDNSSVKAEYAISISNLAGSDKLIGALSQQGYIASIYHEPYEDDLPKPSGHEAIWVGYRVPAAVAIPAIKIAVREWDQLKYIKLSSDGSVPPDAIHSQMYFGGSSATAEQFGLVPFSREQLLEMDENMSTYDLHRFIRRNYT